MSRNPRPNRRAGAAQHRHELCARLGVTARASDRDIDAAHEELVRFLEGAPAGMRRWAQRQIADVDEAHALLSDPAITAASPGKPLARRMALGLLTLAVVVGVVVGVYNLGGGQGEGGVAGAGTEAAGGTDLTPAAQERVARLMTRVEANPNDVASLVRLGDIFFRAGDYNSAGAWMEQALVADPRHVEARLALGAAKFNLGDASDARRQWLEVIAIDPDNVEAHYDLGFLYLSREPPQTDKAKQVWGKVIEIDPDSPVARTVATHLEGLEDR